VVGYVIGEEISIATTAYHRDERFLWEIEGRRRLFGPMDVAFDGLEHHSDCFHDTNGIVLGT
jgi:hypothetical protein